MLSTVVFLNSDIIQTTSHKRKYTLIMFIVLGDGGDGGHGDRVQRAGDAPGGRRGRGWGLTAWSRKRGKWWKEVWYSGSTETRCGVAKEQTKGEGNT